MADRLGRRDAADLEAQSARPAAAESAAVRLRYDASTAAAAAALAPARAHVAAARVAAVECSDAGTRHGAARLGGDDLAALALALSERINRARAELHVARHSMGSTAVPLRYAAAALSDANAWADVLFAAIRHYARAESAHADVHAAEHTHANDHGNRAAELHSDECADLRTLT